MKNAAMLYKFRALDAAAAAIIGFEYHNKVYMMITDEIPAAYIRIERASRGQGAALRMRITAAHKFELVKSGAVEIGTADELKACRKYNRGENFERMVTERFGQEWHKDNVPFNRGADLTVDTTYSIKFNGATLVNEKTLARAWAAR